MFEPMFMRLALVASVATGLSLGVMGVYLVIRRVVFLGLVVANAATLGAAIAQAIGWTPELASLVAGVGAAVALGGVEASSRVSAESWMGWAYAGASSFTVLVLSWTAGGSADTLHLLFGNVLAVQGANLVALTIVAAVIGLLQLLFARRFLLVTFDPEAAKVVGVDTRLWSLTLNLAIGVAAATAVNAIGALSTFALLTLPAMAALLATTSVRATFVTAAALSTVLPSLALAISFYFDLPAGPASVALLALSVPFAAVCTPAVARAKTFVLMRAGRRQTTFNARCRGSASDLRRSECRQQQLRESFPRCERRPQA
ncbi:MAG TPA: metal ABC transporter permease [Vicinamibacterales bacterium]